MDEYPAIDELPADPTLPDPFETLDGRSVTTPAGWRDVRRVELRDLFQHYVYGHVPEPPELSITTATAGSVLDGAATLREVEIDYEPYPAAPSITLALFLPADRDGPVPTFLGLNRAGNHTVVDDESVTISEGWRPERHEPASEAARGARADFWCVAKLIDRGYGFATLFQSDVDPDREGTEGGIRAHVDLDVPEGTAWGTLAAWGWGLSRGVDYLRRDDGVDDSGIAAIGHSRRGKAALFAAAMDDRIALAVPHQSGTGGMALSRDNRQETVTDITETFPHWFCDRFHEFAGREERLPVDQHLLTSLVAPRPLLDTEGLRDYWTNYDSAFRNLLAADRVYEFLGATGLGEAPIVSGSSIDPDRVGSLLQYRRDTEHTLDRKYWDAILDFADAVL
jgi:hypothetical protein